jgi:hypothetical protein
MDSKPSPIVELAAEFGEDVNKIIIDDPNGKGYQRRVLNPNTKTGRYLMQASNSGMYDKGWSTDSFDDVNSGSNFIKKLNPENLRKKAAELLDKQGFAETPKLIVVKPGTATYKDLFAKVTSQRHVADDSQAFYIRVVPGLEGEVQINQNEKGGNNPKTMKIDDLPAGITQTYDLERNKKTINFATLPDVKQKVVFYNEDNYSTKDLLDAHFGGVNSPENRRNIKAMTKDGLSEMLFSNYSDVTGTEKAPTQVGQSLKNIINRGDLYTKLVKGNSGEAYKAIYRGDKLI